MTGDTSITQVFQGFNKTNIAYIVIIIAAYWLLTKLIERLFFWLEGRLSGRFRLYILPSMPVLRIFFLILAIMIIIPLIIKPTFQNLVAILGVVGLALGFAFKDYISSIIAGITVIYERCYRPGDWVKIDDAYGEIKSLGLRTLKLVTSDDTVVTIPHTKIWNTNIYNANDGKRELLCVADFYFHPNHDASQLRQKLYDVALTSPYINLERPIMVVVAEKPWGTHYRLKAYPIDGRDQFQFISDLTVRGKTALSKMDVKAITLPLAVNDKCNQGKPFAFIPFGL